MLHKLLNKQIQKYLSTDLKNNPELQQFIRAIDDSYYAFEKDIYLLNNAFSESEIEYNELNIQLKEEFKQKELSIQNLYEAIESQQDFPFVEEKEKQELLYISKYLKYQNILKLQAQEKLNETNDLLKILLTNIHSGILMVDENRKVIYCNQYFCDMHKNPLSPDEMIGMDTVATFEKEKYTFKEYEKNEQNIESAIQNNETIIGELVETIDGRYFERDYVPIYIKKVFRGSLWKYREVTDQIKSRQHLEQSENTNRQIMNAALDAIIIFDRYGKVSFWNNQAETIFGWETKEVEKLGLLRSILPSKSVKAFVKILEDYIDFGKEQYLNTYLEEHLKNKKGTEFLVKIAITPIVQNNEIVFCSFIQDISIQKNAEIKLKNQEAKFRNIIANMNLGILEVDLDEKINFVNQSFINISGYGNEELVGKKPSDFLLNNEAKKILKKKITLRKNEIADVYELPIITKSGEIRWWAISGAPNFDDKHNLIGSIGIHMDITNKKRLEVALLQEKQKAEEAAKTQKDFLANMSHEIRTPLNAIVGFIRELEKQDLNDIQSGFVKNSKYASKHLLSIVNNILDLTKIEAGEMTLDHNDFDLNQIINGVVAVLESKSKQKELDLKWFISEDNNLNFKGDAIKLEQILFNCIGNAIKFTNKGSITIECNVLKDAVFFQEIELVISDTGIGMEKQYLDTIFNKFSQEENRKFRNFGGTGLGMAITKELVDLMKGTIKISSQKGKGTSISITINLEKGTNKKNKLAKKKPLSIKNLNILLVEDNELNRMVAQNSLHHFKCHVTEATNGVEAITILKTKKFDVILMDILMPEMDGIAATKIIRDEMKITTPIIALTANAFKSEIQKCKKAGMNDYVTKPFDETNLVETIAKHTFKDKKKTTVKTKTKVLYDLTVLSELSRGDKEFVLKIIRYFVNQAPEILEKMEKALIQKEYDELYSLAHKIKPSIASLGIKTLSTKIVFLEELARNEKDAEKISKTFYETKKILLKATMQLNEFIMGKVN